MSHHSFNVMKMNFRYSSESDSDEIQSLFTSVFRNSEGETEGAVIGKLTRDLLEKTEKNDLIVFVATIAAEIKGAIIVTRMPSEEENEIFLLAPVAVQTESQGQGIGQRLIDYGIKELRKNGAKVLVTGKRLDVYSGGTATIPPGVPHAFINRSEDGSVIHFELLPSDNSEDFFHKLVTGEFEDLPKFFEDHGLKLLGPPIQ